jgi:hypothetical protein
VNLPVFIHREPLESVVQSRSIILGEYFAKYRLEHLVENA